jgi:hypothetical protein
MTTLDTPTADPWTEPPFSTNGDGNGAAQRGGSRPWWPFVAVALVVLVGASLIFPAGRHQWAVSIIRQPTNYTALSFADAGHLPSTVTAGTPVRVSFSVANHESKLVRYPYVVTSANVGSDTTPTVLERATVAVPSGGRRTTSTTVTPACTSSSCRITVSLPSHSESIDMLVHVNSPTG